MVKRLLSLSLLVAAPAAHSQTISYILPDAAPPGMAIYTEVIGPNKVYNFGSDGINKCRLELVEQSDASRITITPSVTSWEGRVVSQTIIVAPGAAPGAVPIRLVTESGVSNIDTFYIVSPQRISSTKNAGALGSGGDWGIRSRRNTLVVESLDLPEGSFTVSASDPDSLTPGNQAHLPFTLISVGDVRIAGILSVNGKGIHGIAGGGGGGGRDNFPGGDGFTGGAGTQSKGGVGSGSDGFEFDGGISLNQTAGAIGVGPRWWDDQGGGGGTGFQFGLSGIAGTWYSEGGWNMPGGIGGGSGGGEKAGPDSSFGGGGGGFKTAGESSGPWNGLNGGNPYGNELLVPFCGGSGGAAGNQFGDGRGGDGGAGGGAIHIISGTLVEISGRVTADGADGESTQGFHKSGGGGAGSGGAIAITAPKTNVCGELSAKGGKGGDAIKKRIDGGLDGGDGGDGRIRVVSFFKECEPENPQIFTANVALTERVLIGLTTPNEPVRVYLQNIAGQFEFDSPIELTADAQGRWKSYVPRHISRSEQIIIMQRIRSMGTGGSDQDLWVLTQVNNLLPSGTSSVRSASSGLAFNRIERYGSNLRIALSTQEASTIKLTLIDLLGRELSTVHAQASGTSVEIPLQLPSLTSGTYVLVAESNGEAVTHRLNLAK
jgi:hypothetical protein